MNDADGQELVAGDYVISVDQPFSDWPPIGTIFVIEYLDHVEGVVACTEPGTPRIHNYYSKELRKSFNPTRSDWIDDFEFT